MNEFQIIKNHFASQAVTRPDVELGIGDDCALLIPPAEHRLAITTDTLVSGVHFFATAPASEIGHQAMAVNLSDLAAMGATPAWVTLALTMPSADEIWIKKFCEGFFSLAKHYQVQLIGGDLTHGPLSITVGAYGFVPQQAALLRSGAKAGDLVYVSGTLGNAGLALQQKKTWRAQPRIELGQQLLGIAHAAIDISDGLAADLGHILENSHVGAKIIVDHLPLSNNLQQALPKEQAQRLALTAGDDYELCFTIPKERRPQLEQHTANLACPITCIGEITATPGLEIYFADGKKYTEDTHGYQHF